MSIKTRNVTLTPETGAFIDDQVRAALRLLDGEERLRRPENAARSSADLTE